MAAAKHTLPDLDALHASELKALIFSQHAQLLSKDGQLLSKDDELLSRDAEIEHLKLLIAKLRRVQFGRSSEKLDRQIEQLELRLGELEASRTKEVGLPKPTSGAPAMARPARRPLPDHLPREVRKFLPQQEACPDCGGK